MGVVMAREGAITIDGVDGLCPKGLGKLFRDNCAR